MDTRYCSACVKKLSPPFFLRDASSLPPSKVFATCYICREKSCKKKRPALQEIDLNIGPPSMRQCATSTFRVPFLPSVINQGPIPLVQPLLRPPLPVQPLLHPPLPVQPSVSSVQLLQPSLPNTFIFIDQ